VNKRTKTVSFRVFVTLDEKLRREGVFMKIAVISDIHGNFQALESVLEDIKNQNCEKIFCLGDLALAGPQPRMVLEYITKQTDWEIIQGNTDKLIAEFSPEVFEYVKKMYPMMANALVDDVIVIEDKYKDYLRNLPPQKELEIEDVKILLVHGSPRRNNEDILPDMPLMKIEEILEGTSADIIFCGHTHIPCGYQTNKKQMLVNVGSVGRPMTKIPNPCYAIANFEDGGFEVEHRFVDYDRNLAASIMAARGFEGAKEISDLLIHPSERHL